MTGSTRWRVLLAVLLATAVAAPGAAAREATSREVAQLAAAARGGDAARLAELRAIDVVDGRRVDLAAALPDGLSDADRAARLRTLAAGAVARAPPADAAPAAAARRILAQERYTGDDTGNSRLDRALRAVGDAFLSVVDTVFGPFAPLIATAGRIGVVAVLVALLVGAGLLVSGRRRGAAAALLGAAARSQRAGRDPGQLERLADAAEAAGDRSLALRLRFEAGLVRLDRAGAIRLVDSTTSGAVRGELGSERFDRLADDHDDVVYGGREAGAAQLAAAREGWPPVLDEARRR